MMKVNFYSTEVSYIGRFEEVDPFDLFEIAKAQAKNGDCFDRSEFMEDYRADHFDGLAVISNKSAANKMARVEWSYIAEETEEEKEPSFDDFLRECYSLGGRNYGRR